MTAVVSDERLDELQKTMQRISESGYFVEDATDIIAALTHYRQLRHQQRAAEQWRPIETAPFGQRVLALYRGEQYVIAIRWQDEESPSGWCHQYALQDVAPNRGITGWQPLPPAP